MQVADDHADFFFAQPNVVGVGVTLTAGGQAAVLVMTAGPDDGIPSEVDGVPVVHKVTGALTALQTPSPSPTERWDRPVPIGVSTGHPSITAGTIGARVKALVGANVYALSNNHVYADENSARIGDELIQPGTFDGGSLPNDKIGLLFDFVPLKFKGGFGNKIDAAIALVEPGALDNATPPEGYGRPQSDIVQAVLG